MSKFSVICHKDLSDPIIVYNLLENYKNITGKNYLETVPLKKFNYQGFADYLTAYARSTQWYISKTEKFKKSPYTKVRWLDFIPHIMSQAECDNEKAMHILEYMFSEMVVSQDHLRREVFFSLYTLDSSYLTGEYKLVPEDITNFVFWVEKITEDGVRPKRHPEKIPFIAPEDASYMKKVPNDSLVISKEDKEDIENSIQDRIAYTDSDEEIAFLLKLSEKIGLGVLK